MKNNIKFEWITWVFLLCTHKAAVPVHQEAGTQPLQGLEVWTELELFIPSPGDCHTLHNVWLCLMLHSAPPLSPVPPLHLASLDAGTKVWKCSLLPFMTESFQKHERIFKVVTLTRLKQMHLQPLNINESRAHIPYSPDCVCVSVCVSTCLCVVLS